MRTDTWTVSDAFIAATAEAHTLTLVTPNLADFRSAVKAVFDPGSESAGGKPDRRSHPGQGHIAMRSVLAATMLGALESGVRAAREIVQAP